MGFEFNADEILKIAEQLEINGANFYRSAAQNINNADKQKLLIHLAEMEDEHLQTFKKMHDELSISEKVLTTFDPDNQSANYLKALADTRVFYEKSIDSTDMKEIFKMAITAEKDSIVFYLGMKEIVPAHLGKNKLDAIIKEEMDHISLLSKELLELKK
jgi:rubrerythrin